MSRSILQVFENYQHARVTFVQSIAELAQRSQHLEVLESAGVVFLLQPLLVDKVAIIHNSAIIALGRLANHSEHISSLIVNHNLLDPLLPGLLDQCPYYKKSVASLFRAVARHNEKLAEHVVKMGFLSPLINLLEDCDVNVKESAIWAFGALARHNLELANMVQAAGTIPLLVLAYKETHLPIKRIAASALGDLAKHAIELAQEIADQGVIPHLVKDLDTDDVHLRRQLLCCLGTLAKHSAPLSVSISENLFPRVLHSLNDRDEVVRRNCANLLKELSRHTCELATLVADAGGVVALVDFLRENQGNTQLPGLIALGNIAGYSEELALNIIVAQGVLPLKDALVKESQDYMKGAAAWALGQVGSHTPEHARAVVEEDTLYELLKVYLDESHSQDCKLKAKRALKLVVQKCTDVNVLEPLIMAAPQPVLKTIMGQFTKILPHNVETRKSFYQSGALKKLQALDLDPDSELRESIAQINKLFPADLINFCTPTYCDTLVSQMTE